MLNQPAKSNFVVGSLSVEANQGELSGQNQDPRACRKFELFIKK